MKIYKLIKLYNLTPKSRLKFVLVGVISFFCLAAFSAPNMLAGESDLDGSYTPTVDNVIFSIAVQPNGKSIIGGTFSTVNGQARKYITRLNLDGTLDAAFNSTTSPNGGVFSVVLQPDGKVLVGGGFTVFDGAPHGRIVRLNTDGTVDNTFNSPVGANNSVETIALQSDGKILIGGSFTTYDAAARTFVARLNADGSLDTTFNATVTFSQIGGVRVVIPINNGTIYIGGAFDRVNSTNRYCIARLNASGSLDTTFNPGSGGGYVEAILPQPGGEVLVGGSFNSFNGASRIGVVRLNATGSVDGTFQATSLQNFNLVYNLVPQPGGKVLISGSITSLNGNTSGSGYRHGIIRVNPDGSRDTTFTVNDGTNGTVNATAIQPDGKILIGGQFISYNNINQAPLARLNGMPVTAAGVSVSGRVTTYNGRGVGRAQIILTEADGTTRSAISNSRGNFRFDEIAAGQTCVIAIQSKRFRFGEPTRVVYLTDNVSDLDFVALPERWDNVMPYKMLKIEHFEKAASRMNH